MGLAEFVAARLDEDEARVYREGTPPNGVIAWLTYLAPDGSMGYTTVAHGDSESGHWVADGKELPPPASVLVVHDPARVLRGIAANRAIVEAYAETKAALERSANRPGESAARDYLDAERELCALEPVVRELAAVWPDHADYDLAWCA